MRIRIDPKILFQKHVYKTKTCWLWMARISPFGYGQFGFNGTMKQAHRVSFEIYKSKIPKGLCVLHVCDNRRCVNPDHLWLGTQADNVQDMILKNRGLKAIGDRNGSAKLSWDKVNEIRKLRKDSGILYKDLASKFNVHISTIKRIILNKYWKI